MQALLQATLERSSMPHALKMEAAIAYARNHGLHALLVARGSDVLAQEVGDGFQVDTPHALYSGTKSFWGVAAIYACADGLLELDEPLAETIDLWRDDPWKRRITARMLLSLTAGFGFGGLGASVPTYDRALGMPLKNEPGSGFKYGGIPFQAFGAFFARKLFATGLTPHEYLRERVLDPAGVRIGSWRQLSDGTQPLPTGASLSAVNWLTYGRFVLRERVALKSCFEGSAKRTLRARVVARRARRSIGPRVRERLGGPRTLSRPFTRPRDRTLREKLVVSTRRLLKAALRMSTYARRRLGEP